jgi:hypothetical protein
VDRQTRAQRRYVEERERSSQPVVGYRMDGLAWPCFVPLVLLVSQG